MARKKFSLDIASLTEELETFHARLIEIRDTLESNSLDRVTGSAEEIEEVRDTYLIIAREAAHNAVLLGMQVRRAKVEARIVESEKKP